MPARFRTLAPALLGLSLLGLGPAAHAQVQSVEPPSIAKPAPYDDKLTRLAEILGSIHYLRNLCDQAGEPEWRVSMQKLIEAETASEPERRARLTASFNRGFRAFAAVHTECTDAALAAETQYRAEGATLAAEITSRYGN